MKITKLVHSCVLVESDNGNILFDPGIFSWNSGLVSVANLPQLDAVVVSHAHPDHCGEPFVRALAEKYPQIQWFAPEDAHVTLKGWSVRNVSSMSMDNFQVEQGDHAPVEPIGKQVQNLQMHWDGIITHPGDSHDIKRTGKVLFMPFQAPWGTTIHAVEVVQQLRPQYVLPIHDWMWNDAWREDIYDRLEGIFTGTETTFLRPVDGQPIEVDA